MGERTRREIIPASFLLKSNAVNQVEQRLIGILPTVGALRTKNQLSGSD